MDILVSSRVLIVGARLSRPRVLLSFQDRTRPTPVGPQSCLTAPLLPRTHCGPAPKSVDTKGRDFRVEAKSCSRSRARRSDSFVSTSQVVRVDTPVVLSSLHVGIETLPSVPKPYFSEDTCRYRPRDPRVRLDRRPSKTSPTTDSVTISGPRPDLFLSRFFS